MECHRPRTPADGDVCEKEAFDFSGEVYAAPFGRYEVATPTEGSANEILVGRERERARVTDWLLTMARSGALLVTGHRGVGKSQFVHFCLNEFEQMIYKRYLRSTIGRVWFWDLGLALALLLFALFIPVLCAGLLEIYYHPSLEIHALPTRLFGLLLVAPMLLFALFPLLYALRTFDVASDVLAERTAPVTLGGRLQRAVKHVYRARRTLVYLLCLVVCVCAWAFGPFANPSSGIAWQLCFGAWLHAVVHALSIRCESWPLRAAPSDASFVHDSA